jgi:Xaa-Pro aminopeptidase
MDQIEDGVALIRNTDKDDDFYYLTGLNEDNAVCILDPASKQPFVLFLQPYSPRRALWDGNQIGIGGAMSEFGADTAYAIHKFDDQLGRFLRGKKVVYTPMHQISLRDQISGIISRPWPGIPQVIANIQPKIHEMRVIKDSHEIKLLRKAIDITCHSHIEAMKAARPRLFKGGFIAIFTG